MQFLFKKNPKLIYDGFLNKKIKHYTSYKGIYFIQIFLTTVLFKPFTFHFLLYKIIKKFN